MKKTICLYFQVHQPDRLRQYRFFDICRDSHYYDDFANRTILKRVAQTCYLPANRLLSELIRKHEGAFRVAIRIVAADTTGMANHITETVIRDLKLNIRSMNLSSRGGLLSGTIDVEVPATSVVDTLIYAILRIKGVQKAFRVNG